MGRVAVTAAEVTDTAATDDRAWPLVTVNVLAYQRKDVLRRTLRAILADLDYPADRLDVIVVDNGSSDGTSEMVRNEFPEVQLIENENNVGTAGWNRGFAAGRGTYFLVLDDDCYITGHSLKDLVLAAEASDADLVSCRSKTLGPEEYVFNEEFETGLLSFWGSSALIGRRAIDRLGGFDPRIFSWGSELNFTMRLLDHGLTHTFTPEVVALHDKVPTAFNPFFFRHNMRALSYIVAKAMTPQDAVVALFNLASKVLLETLQRPETRVGLPAVFRGAVDGLRNRSPVRPGLSRTYRRHFLDFASPLMYVRGPRQRWSGRGVASAAEAIRARRQRFWDTRPDLYPRHLSSLRVSSRTVTER